jgi:hypothetical protein
MKLGSFSLAALAAVLVWPGLSSATVVYSNLGAGSSYDTSRGNIIGNDLEGDNLAAAVEFSPGSTVSFTSLRIALSCLGLGWCPDDFTVSLNADNSGAPGSVIESFVVDHTLLGLFGNNNTLFVFNSVLNPVLTATVPYWITVMSSLNDTVVWNWNNTSSTSATNSSVDGGSSWYDSSGLATPGAFEVDGNPLGVPEPGTVSLFLSGAGLLALVRKLRR